MRVIAGTQKGRRLKAPVGNRIRPTSARVREALFSILNTRVSEAKVLDLCCGAGTIGLEALSRGASRVVFVDNHLDSLQLLKDNLKRCGNPNHTVIVSSDAWNSVRQPQILQEAPYDIIYVDPPYQHQELESLLSKVGTQHLLSDEGIMVVEHFWKTALLREVNSLEQVRQARYGDTILTFFQHIRESHANRRLPGNI
ncbi:16S rRNA (guanine(966)-N(2))-methyltransferase RsmD [Candidatus Nitrospira salsa]|nr:MAG: methyltransferase [Nitrospirales bacterium]